MSYERNKINSFSVTHAPISDTFESAHEVMAKAPSLKSARLMQQTSSAPTLTDSQRVEWQELIDSKSDAYRYRWGGIVSAVGVNIQVIKLNLVAIFLVHERHVRDGHSIQVWLGGFTN